MVAVISNLFGLQHLDIAEDIVSETFLLAAETWATKEMPENPSAWLYTVAKHQTSHYFKRNKIFNRKVVPILMTGQEDPLQPEDPDFSDGNIMDSQLKMLFAICNPAIVSEAQIGLALRILCGFGIDEIAEAFLTNKETINKRLFRAKEKLRKENVPLEMPQGPEINNRLDNVLHIIYLLFNEGYYSKTKNETLRKDLCVEALHLGVLLTRFEKTNLPRTNALIALICYHSSRFKARQATDNSQILYENQDKELWDDNLISKGDFFLALSAQGDEMTSYHLEARIAYWHSQKNDPPEKWDKILKLYNELLQINYSPSVALNRTYALYKAKGATLALIEAEKLKLDNSHFYFTLLGELQKNLGHKNAKTSFQKAYGLAITQNDKEILLQKINSL
ncbi:RNA polymerase sigma factor [Flavitalea flava]